MSQKIENILNLALEATPEERARSAELDVGYEAGERAWDLIIKYSSGLDVVREISESVTELLNNYAVVRIREDRIEALASLPEVEFVEKPKSLYFQVDVGRQVSCIDAVQEAPYDLTGRGVLVGIVDSGIDLANPDFRNEDGTTRVAALWDQADREYTAKEINDFLNAEGTGQPAVQQPLSADSSGHGTAVAGIAAGNGRGSGVGTGHCEDEKPAAGRLSQDDGAYDRRGLPDPEGAGDANAHCGQYQFRQYVRAS